MQWVAKVAAAEKDYRAALDHMERAGAPAEQQEAAAGPGKASASAELNFPELVSISAWGSCLFESAVSHLLV